MVESITININGVSTKIEIPFGYIPVYDGATYEGDMAYQIVHKKWHRLNADELYENQVCDCVLVIRPTFQ